MSKLPEPTLELPELKRLLDELHYQADNHGSHSDEGPLFLSAYVTLHWFVEWFIRERHLEQGSPL